MNIKNYVLFFSMILIGNGLSCMEMGDQKELVQREKQKRKRPNAAVKENQHLMQDAEQLAYGVMILNGGCTLY